MPNDQPADLRFIEFVHARRVAVGLVFVGLAILSLAVAGYCAYRGLRTPPPAAVTTDQPKADEPKADTPPELEPVPYRIGLASALIAALGIGGVGAFFVGAVPSPDPNERRRKDRILLLVGGYVFGLALRLAGLLLFVVWFDKLRFWVLDAPNSHKTAWQPVAALLAYLIGAGITFLGTLPARAEERNSSWVRRMVYAVHLGVSVVTVVVGLVAVNALVSKEWEEPLDASGGEFATLSSVSQNYLTGLKKKVHVYAITSGAGSTRDRRAQADALRVLRAMQAVNPNRVEVEELSAVYDRGKLDALRLKFPQAENDLQGLGVLLTADDVPDRHVFANFQTMTKTDREGGTGFVGEAQLVSGMMHLTEGRATAYFTQASREPAIERPADRAAPPGRLATRLGEILAASECAAKPLVVDPLAEKASVPPDADLVVVLDPLDTLPEKTVAALREYMTPADPKKRKGRLLVFAPAHNVADDSKVVDTGLEPLLAEFGIGLTDRVIYTKASDQLPPTDRLPIVTPPTRGNPFQAATRMTATRPRFVGLSPQGGQSGQAVPALFVQSRGYQWLEPRVADSPQLAWDNLIAAARRKDVQYQDERQVAVGATRPVGVLAVDAEDKPAVVVFGFADGLTDDREIADNGPPAKLLTDSVNWLRQRPEAPDLSSVAYLKYTPKAGVNGDLLFTVPVVGTLLGIVLLGLGVWAVRRK